MRVECRTIARADRTVGKSFLPPSCILPSHDSLVVFFKTHYAKSAISWLICYIWLLSGHILWDALYAINRFSTGVGRLSLGANYSICFGVCTWSSMDRMDAEILSLYSHTRSSRQMSGGGRFNLLGGHNRWLDCLVFAQPIVTVMYLKKSSTQHK